MKMLGKVTAAIQC